MEPQSIPTASDVMTREVATASPSWPIAELERVFSEKHVSGLPVVEGHRLVGVVSISDVIRKINVERSRAGEISDYFGSLDPKAEAVVKSLEDEEHFVADRLMDECVRDVMSPATFVVAPTLPISEVAALLCEQHIHRVPVVDKGRLVGILSALDIVGLVARGAYAPK